MITKGYKTSEFYVALLVVLVWGTKYLGLDAYITPDNINQVAEAIKAGRSHGVDPASFAGVAYVVGRVLIKFKAKGGVADE